MPSSASYRTLNGMLSALEEVVTAFPVYRTYVTREGASSDDLRYIEWALAQAKNAGVSRISAFSISCTKS